MTLAAVPVKRFFVAKRRLGPVLDARTRSVLGRNLARHTLGVIAAAGAEPLVLAADEDVADWAKRAGFAARLDQGNGLDEPAAAAAATAHSAGRPWMIVHADLPLLDRADVAAALEILDGGRSVLAPSSDGGSPLVGGHRPIRFAYGPGSFRRHLARLDDPAVLVRVGLALDLDDPSDLRAALAHPDGAWIERLFPAS